MENEPRCLFTKDFRDVIVQCDLNVLTVGALRLEYKCIRQY